MRLVLACSRLSNSLAAHSGDGEKLCAVVIRCFLLRGLLDGLLGLTYGSIKNGVGCCKRGLLVVAVDQLGEAAHGALRVLVCDVDNRLDDLWSPVGVAGFPRLKPCGRVLPPLCRFIVTCFFTHCRTSLKLDRIGVFLLLSFVVPPLFECVCDCVEFPGCRVIVDALRERNRAAVMLALHTDAIALAGIVKAYNSKRRATLKCAVRPFGA